MTETRTHVLPAGDGRRVWVEDSGAADGFPVLVHAGSPGSRRLFGPDAAHAAAEHGIRLLSYDRPGFGETPLVPGRTIADGAGETRVIAEGLGLSRIGVWGFSGGGSYALACAALLPDLVVAACVFSSLAPFGAEGLDFSAGWSDAHRAEVELFFEQPEPAREHFRTEADELYAVLSTPEGWMRRWGTAAGTDPAHSLDVAEYLAATQRDCLAHGDQGWWDDWVAILSPWGFDLDGIRVPVRLWHGARDASVPVAHGRWLADRVPGIEAHFPEDEDHTNIEANHRCQAYEWLKRYV